jgi:hypothetical protein
VRRTLQRPSNSLTIVGKQPIDKEEAQWSFVLLLIKSRSVMVKVG